MHEHLPRSIEQIVEDQARRWAHVGHPEVPAPPRPVVTVSRQHGAGGGEVARRLALELGFDFLDREIITEIARSTHMSARVVGTLDEKDRDVLSDWLAAVASDNYLSTAAYRAHLIRLVEVIANRGGAVILGRGAHIILRSTRALRVFVVAPLEARIAEVSRREGSSETAARRRIVEVEAERRAFLARHFHADSSDLSSFDIVVNTEVLGLTGAVAAARSAVEALSAGASLGLRRPGAS